MSSIQSPAAPAETELDPAAVTTFLRGHPEFFVDHPELVAELRLPHGEAGAVSLVEYQVQGLREENAELRQRLTALITVARANEALQARFHALWLGLLEAVDVADLCHRLTASLRESFAAEEVALALAGLDPAPECGEGHLRPFEPDSAPMFEFVLARGQPLCGRLTGEQAGYLFGAAGAEIASALVVPVGAGGRDGLLGLASRDPARYPPDQDTTYLRQLGEFVGAQYRQLRR